MEFLCKKDCYMLDVPPEFPDVKVFTAGKKYSAIPEEEHEVMGHCVIDDDGEPNWIGRPNDGHAFFDEYFDNQEIQRIKDR